VVPGQLWLLQNVTPDWPAGTLFAEVMVCMDRLMQRGHPVTVDEMMHNYRTSVLLLRLLLHQQGVCEGMAGVLFSAVGHLLGGWQHERATWNSAWWSCSDVGCDITAL